MLRDVVTTCALLVSVIGIGVSLAREEMRCYLGLQSSKCPPSQIKSASPSSELETNQATQKTQRPSESNQDTKSLTKTIKPLSAISENSEGESPSSVESLTNSNEPEILEPNNINIEPLSPVEEISSSQPIPVEPILEQSSSPQEPTPMNDSPLASEEETFGIPIKVEPFEEFVDSNP